MTVRQFLGDYILKYVQARVRTPNPRPVNIAEMIETALLNMQDLHNFSEEKVKELAVAGAEAYRKWREACPERIGRDATEDESVEFLSQYVKAVCGSRIYREQDILTPE